MFIDSEGDPIQELSAIALSAYDYTILAVYHQFAKCPEGADPWSRAHIHGLNPEYLSTHGFPDEAALISNFQDWYQQFSVIQSYGNNPIREMAKLKLTVEDIGLPKWMERYHCPYHQIPQLHKLSRLPIHGLIACDPKSHNCFKVESLEHCRTPTRKVKYLHGYHCSLADVYEVCLYYLKTHVL